MPIHKIVEDMRIRYRQGDAGAVDALARVIGPYLRRIVRRALRSPAATSEFTQHIRRLAGSGQENSIGSSIASDVRLSQVCERLCEAMLRSDPVAREILPAHETLFGTARLTVA
jgi:hypothetical protein